MNAKILDKGLSKSFFKKNSFSFYGTPEWISIHSSAAFNLYVLHRDHVHLKQSSVA